MPASKAGGAELNAEETLSLQSANITVQDAGATCDSSADPSLSSKGPRRARQCHILVVDDCTDDRVLFTEYLTRQGFRVSKARDGKAALAKAVLLQPHLIILDLWMPFLSGWDVMKRLKGNPATKPIPIIVVTAHSWVRPLECEGFLWKPCPLNELRVEIARILKTHGWEIELPPDSGTNGLQTPPVPQTGQLNLFDH